MTKFTSRHKQIALIFFAMVLMCVFYFVSDHLLQDISFKSLVAVRDGHGFWGLFYFYFFSVNPVNHGILLLSLIVIIVLGPKYCSSHVAPMVAVFLILYIFLFLMAPPFEMFPVGHDLRRICNAFIGSNGVANWFQFSPISRSVSPRLLYAYLILALRPLAFILFSVILYKKTRRVGWGNYLSGLILFCVITSLCNSSWWFFHGSTRQRDTLFYIVAFLLWSLLFLFYPIWSILHSQSDKSDNGDPE